MARIVYGISVPSEVIDVFEKDSKEWATFQGDWIRYMTSIGSDVGIFGEGKDLIVGIQLSSEFSEPIRLDTDLMNTFTDDPNVREIIPKMFEKVLPYWVEAGRSIREDYVKVHGSPDGFENLYPHLGIPESIEFDWYVL